MKRQCDSFVVLVFVAIFSLNAGFAMADEFDDEQAAWEKERAAEAAEVAAWEASGKPKPDTPCQTAWKSNSANHSCISSTISDEPNDQCRFTSISCPKSGTSPTDDWSESKRGEFSTTHVNTSIVYEGLLVPISVVGKYNNCDGKLTVDDCNK